MAQPEFDHQKLDIKPRHMDFPFGSLKELKYFSDNIYKSSFMAGLSASFPAGEGEFLDSVRNYRDQIKNPDLKQQVKGFIGQEAHHSRQHEFVNSELDRLGYRTELVENALKKEIAKLKAKQSNQFRLAYTVCSEHITAIMAEHALNEPAFLAGMEAPMKDLLLWHAVEEIEHKSVAFDVYMEVVGDVKYLNKIMKICIIMLHIHLTQRMFKLAFNTKHWASFKEFGGFLSWMFGKGGMWRSLRQPF
ncbi:hypothetical protein A9Q73_11370, partial [Bermanella sp. 47_1433_sub80_T6]